MKTASTLPVMPGKLVRHIDYLHLGHWSSKALATCTLLALGGLDWVWAWRAGLSFIHFQTIGMVVASLLLLGHFYAASGRSTSLADMANYGALWIGFSVLAAIFTYLTASLGFPLCDAGLAGIDSALGFDWLAWFHFVSAHPPLRLLLAIVYSSLMVQIAGSIIYFSHCRRGERNDELWWCALVSLLFTGIISGIFPALGAFVTFNVAERAMATHLPHLLALRGAGISSFALQDMQGIISLPSYHTVLAILLIYVHRGERRRFSVIAVINGFMLLSVPSEGGHYMIDMIAGGSVAIFSILLVRAALRYAPSRRETIIVRQSLVSPQFTDK